MEKNMETDGNWGSYRDSSFHFTIHSAAFTVLCSTLMISACSSWSCVLWRTHRVRGPGSGV